MSTNNDQQPCKYSAETAMPRIVLQTFHLSKYFGGIRALDDITFAVKLGQTHAIIGPNGAGKTTLLAQLAGQMKPDKGRIQFEGKDITKLSCPRRARLGLARSFQTSSVIMPMTLLENVMLAVQARRGHSFRFWSPLHQDRTIRAVAMQSLNSVGLEAHADSSASQVAHGQHRQLEIAIALAMQPKLLLLDEPTAGMGAEESAQLVAMLSRLKGKITILLIEHDMSAVFALADTISVLVGGQLLATDTAINIRNNAEVQRAYLGEN